MENLPIGAEIDGDQLWSQILNRPQTLHGGAGRRPALFLDRDGVIVEEAHYLSKPEDVVLLDGAAKVIAKANRLAVPVIVVTNQSGIGRGYFGWEEFVQVQERIIEDLDKQGAFINAVFACPHHKDGDPPYDSPNHAWRKPNPGMLLEAALRMPIDLKQSWLIGDHAGDIQAALNAGLPGATHVLTGHGSDERSGAMAVEGDGFESLMADSIAGVEGVLALLRD